MRNANASLFSSVSTRAVLSRFSKIEGISYSVGKVLIGFTYDPNHSRVETSLDPKQLHTSCDSLSCLSFHVLHGRTDLRVDTSSCWFPNTDINTP